MNLNLTQLTLVAFLVESLIQTFKPLYDKEKGWNKNSLLALAVGIVVSVATGFDLFELLGIEVQFPYVGSVLTGILASRGSNFLHDIFKFVEQRAHTEPSASNPVG
ncbi:MAG: hypothetical protein AB1846_05570 [Chloroflexota bacterium]